MPNFSWGQSTWPSYLGSMEKYFRKAEQHQDLWAEISSRWLLSIRSRIVRISIRRLCLPPSPPLAVEMDVKAHLDCWTLKRPAFLARPHVRQPQRPRRVWTMRLLRITTIVRTRWCCAALRLKMLPARRRSGRECCQNAECGAEDAMRRHV
jgi:hypothetical protein